VQNGKSNIDSCYVDPLSQDPATTQYFLSCPWPRASGQQTSFKYTESGLWHVNVVARDSHGGTYSQVFQVNIANTSPGFVPNTLSTQQTGTDEGSAQTTISGQVNDLGDDPLAVVVDWGDGTTSTQYFPCNWATQVTFDENGVVVVPPDICLDNNVDFQLRPKPAAHPTDFSLSHTYTDNPPSGSTYSPSVLVKDDEDYWNSASGGTVTVNNVKPDNELGCGIPTPPGPGFLNVNNCEYRFGDTNYSVPLSGSFFDPGSDTQQLAVNWGDGTIDTFNYPCAQGAPCPFGPDPTYTVLAPLVPPGTVFYRVHHTYSSPGPYTITSTATDEDDAADAKTATANISPPPPDTAPSIGLITPIDGHTYLLNESVIADYSCSDDHTVASCIGTVADGAATDTSTVGTHSFTVDAMDNIGLTSSNTVHYNVVYDFSWLAGLLSSPNRNQLVAGAKTRVRFNLDGPHGLDASKGVPRQHRIDCFSGESLGRPSTNQLSKVGYRGDLDSYYFVYQTRAAWAGTCREVVLTLNDGTQHTIWFRLNPAGAAADSRKLGRIAGSA